MPEKIEESEKPMPCYLRAEERYLSRPLYESVFPEDSQRFVDYYYEYKIRDNEILCLREDGVVIAMLHLNPYTLIVNGYEVKSNYIVAVGTHKDYRHRGYMRILLEKALNDMATKGMSFTFLMPASEAIYAPFDFAWICPHTELPRRIEQMDAEEQNRYLAGRYQMFCKRNKRYMENRKAEKRAEEGEIFSGNIPPYMARITDVCQMLRLTRSTKRQRLYLHVKDSIIEKNNGYFCWESSPETSTAKKLLKVPEKIDMELTIGELASMVFGSFRICLSELV